MGQFLAIGLPYKIIAIPERANKPVTLEDVRAEMERSLHYDMNLYDGEEGEKSHILTLKNEPLKEGLLPFLESFYPKIYAKMESRQSEDSRDSVKALETLRSIPFEQWIDFASDKSNYAFQMSECSGLKNLEIQKDFRPRVQLRLDCIILYHGSGKIITEGIGDFTTFFKFCMQEAFAEHPIVKAVEIYVTC